MEDAVLVDRVGEFGEVHVRERRVDVLVGGSDAEQRAIAEVSLFEPDTTTWSAAPHYRPPAACAWSPGSPKEALNRPRRPYDGS